MVVCRSELMRVVVLWFFLINVVTTQVVNSEEKGIFDIHAGGSSNTPSDVLPSDSAIDKRRQSPFYLLSAPVVKHSKFEQEDHSEIEHVVTAVSWIVVLVWLLLGVACVCDEYMVPSVLIICQRLKLSDEVAGATFLALGNGASEILLNIIAVITGRVETSLSVIFGSEIISFSLVPALAAYTSGLLLLRTGQMARDVGFSLIGTVTVSYCITDGQFGLIDGLWLTLLYVAYLATVFLYAPQHVPQQEDLSEPLLEDGDTEDGIRIKEKAKRDGGFDSVALNAGDGEHHDEVSENGVLHSLQFPFRLIFSYTIPDPVKYPNRHMLTFICSMLFLSLLAEGVLELAEVVANLCRASDEMTGATIVALGAQLPDLVAAVSMAKRGMVAGAVAGAYGSQVINVTIGMGLPFLIRALATGESIHVESDSVTLVTAGLAVTALSFFVCCLMCYHQHGSLGLTNNSSLFMIGVYVVVTTTIVVLSYKGIGGW